MIFTGLPKDII